MSLSAVIALWGGKGYLCYFRVLHKINSKIKKNLLCFFFCLVFFFQVETSSRYLHIAYLLRWRKEVISTSSYQTASVDLVAFCSYWFGQ